MIRAGRVDHERGGERAIGGWRIEDAGGAGYPLLLTCQYMHNRFSAQRRGRMPKTNRWLRVESRGTSKWHVTEPGKKREEKIRSRVPSLLRFPGVDLLNLQRWPKGEIGLSKQVQVEVDRGKNRTENTNSNLFQELA